MSEKEIKKAEYLDVLDIQGNTTGQTCTYIEAHEKGLIHAAVHVWIINSDGHILIQKRSSDRRFYPSCWDISAAGHVSAGQTSVKAAVREVKEELALDINMGQLKFIGRLWQEKVFPELSLVNREFNDIFLVRLPITSDTVSFNDGEVEAVQFLTIDKFKEWVAGEHEPMVPHEEEYKLLLNYLESK